MESALLPCVDEDSLCCIKSNDLRKLLKSTVYRSPVATLELFRNGKKVVGGRTCVTMNDVVTLLPKVKIT